MATSPRTALRPDVPGIRLFLALGAFYVAYNGQLLLEGRLRISTGVVYFLVATLLLVLADMRRPVAGADPAPPVVPSRWRVDLGLWLLAIAVGMFFRFHLLGSQPWGVWFDEAENGLIAQRILNDPNYRPVFIGDAAPIAALFYYVWAVAIKFLGANVFAVRAVTTFAGIVTLFLLYLLARDLFDRRVAALSTFFLAVMRWHVNFSRFGMHGIFSPLFTVACFYFLVRGLKGRGAWNFAAAGLMVGIGLQGYYSFMLTPIVVALYVLHHTFSARVLTWPRLLLGLIGFAVVTVLVFSPVGIWALRHPAEFNARLGTVSITSGRTPAEVREVLWRSTQKHLLMFNSVGDGNGRHNLPAHPMLDTYTGLAFVLGVGYALWRWRNASYFLLLAWVAVSLQAGIWSLDFEAPQGYRTLTATPAIAMLAALPVAVLWHLAADLVGRRSRGMLVQIGSYGLAGVAAFVTIFLLAGATWLNFDTYFHKQLTRSDAWASYSTDATFAGNEVARLGNSHTVYCSPFLSGLPTMVFLAPNAPPTIRFDAPRDLPLDNAKPVVFILSNVERPVFELIKSYYPNGQFVEFGPPDGGSPPIAFEAIISSKDIEATRGLITRYKSGQNSWEGRVQALDLDWTKAAPLSLPLEAEWVGLLKVPTYGSYTFQVRAPGAVELYWDGKRIASGDGIASTGDMIVSQGLHDLKVRATVRSLGPIQLTWKQNQDALVPVPTALLFTPPIARQGLEGSYFSDAPPEGLKFVRIDPFPGGHLHILPLSIPFSIRWRGHVAVPSNGNYRFVLQAVDEGTLTIDGRHLATTPGPNVTAEGTAELTQGPHDIEITFKQRGGSPAYINVYWGKPETGVVPLPGSSLSPP